MRLSPFLAVLAVVPSLSMAAPRQSACSDVRITTLGTRLQGVPDSGSFVAYEGGAMQVWYDTMPQIVRSRVGDRVKLCVVETERDCPRGTEPVITYSATNQRTGEGWLGSSSSHSCRGA